MIAKIPQDRCEDCNEYKETIPRYNRYQCPKFVPRDVDAQRDDRCLNFDRIRINAKMA